MSFIFPRGNEMFPLTFNKQTGLTKLSPLLFPCFHVQHFPHNPLHCNMFNSLKYSPGKPILISNYYYYRPKALPYDYLHSFKCLLYLM